MKDVAVSIPAFNKEHAVGRVLAEIPSERVREVIVANNNSIDQTARVAAAATVLDEPRQGYGRACLKGIAYVKKAQAVWPRIVVFLDADYFMYGPGGIPGYPI